MNKMNSMEAFLKIDLYPVISSEFCGGKNPIEVLRQIADGGAKIVQMREKNIDDEHFILLAEEFRKITLEYKMLLIINDRVEIALRIGADGVHLGQDDMPLGIAKKLGPALLFGLSTHSLEEVVNAQNDNADYINIGPLFSTATKTLGMSPLGIDSLKKIIPSVTVPFTVMGGIKEKHIAELLTLNASRIAMVTEITQASNISEKVKHLRTLWGKE